MGAGNVIAGFAAAWNTGSDTERLRLLMDGCLPDAVFAASQEQVTGTAEMSASIGEYRVAFSAAAAAVRFGEPDVRGRFGRMA